MIKLLRLLILSFVTVIANSSLPCCAYPHKDAETCLYVSAAIGNDNNAGTDNIRPLRTIATAISKGIKNIRLKRGDVFYENVVLEGKTLSAYGNGTKPVICGWKHLRRAKWKQVDKNIWQLDLEAEGYSGRTKSRTKFLNDIGLIRDETTGKIYGVKAQCLYKKDCIFKFTSVQMNSWLQKEMDFCQTSKYGNVAIDDSDFRYLYLYSSKDPDTMSFAVSTYGNGITAQNSTIDGIAVLGFSCHGIAAGSNTKIVNCDISFVGGAQQMNYPNWTRYGNGIEFYISKPTENGYAARNNISHTFDCGTTIQGSNRVGAYPKNIVFEHNKIYNCRQAFEYFLNNYDKKTDKKYDCVDCAFRKNICIDNGNNGFGTHETRDGQILSYQNDYISSIKIENNIFVGGTSLYFAIHPENVRFGKGNVFYLTEGTTLWSPYQANGRIKYSSNNIKDVRKKLIGKGVDIGKFKLVKVSAKKLEKLKKKYLETNL